jgi:hypothetical protein
MAPPKLQKDVEGGAGPPVVIATAHALSKLIDVFFGLGRRAAPPPWWPAAPLAEEPVEPKPREAAQAAQLPQEGRSVGTAVLQQRRAIGWVLPQMGGSPVVVPRWPVGGSPAAASQWQAIDSQVAEQPDRVAQGPESEKEHGQPVRVLVSAAPRHSGRRALRRGPHADRWSSAAAH